MKTTLEIPDPLLRKAKSKAAGHRLQARIDEHFETIEPEDRW